MQKHSRAQRLAKRYPILHSVPPEKRAELVRAALFHPIVLGGAVIFGLILMPRYLEWMFYLLRIETEPSPIFAMAKMGFTMLLPAALLVPLLTKLVMPHYIRKVMIKRGFSIEEPLEKKPPKKKRQR